MAVSHYRRASRASTYFDGRIYMSIINYRDHFRELIHNHFCEGAMPWYLLVGNRRDEVVEIAAICVGLKAICHL